MSIVDHIAAVTELTELLSRWDAEGRIADLLAEHARTTIGDELMERMTDEWAQERHLGSLTHLREMAEDDDDDGDLWAVALRLLADRGLVVSVTFTRGVVAVMPPTPNMAGPDEPHWVCFTCGACDPIWLETTDDEGMVLEVCSVCGVPRSAQQRPPKAVGESIFGPA